MNFVQRPKYIENELVLYDLVKELSPKIIVELGYGTGALTVAMSYAIDNSNIFSYDIINNNLIKNNLSDRNLFNKNNHTIIPGNVFNTFFNSPFPFDFILIDIDNTWELLYSIIIKNEFMYNQIKPGGKIIIEGGSNAHPRINRSTLNQFHNKLGKKVFDFEHISGPRTSLSKLKLL
jgi:predicted O-methyltransferase YrrM